MKGRVDEQLRVHTQKIEVLRPIFNWLVETSPEFFLVNHIADIFDYEFFARYIFFGNKAPSLQSEMF